MASQRAATVRVVIDIRTFEPEDLMKVLRAQKDSLGDHYVSVVLPAMGFEGKAQAGGNVIHEHEEGDRTCQALLHNDRLWRDDGQDEI